MKNENYILITPVKDEERHIADVIDSVLNQTVKPKLWIIINDDSKDNSLKIIINKTKDFSFVKIISKKINKDYNWLGYGKVIKEGIDYCKKNNIFNSEIGYLGILDSDIEVEPDYFEKLISVFQKDKSFGIISGGIYEKTNKGWKLSNKGEMPAGGARLYNISALKEIDFLKETPSPDTVSNIKIKNRGYKLLSLEKIRVFHKKNTLRKPKRIFMFGKSRYILGAGWLHTIAVSIQRSFTKKPFLIGGIVYFLGYFGSFLKKEKRIEDKEIIQYWKDFWKRSIDLKNLRISRYFCFNLNTDLKNTILLIGSGRSGTTIISNIINYQNSFRYLFEPFKLEKEMFSGKHGSYLRPGQYDQKKHKIIEKILSGRIQSFQVNKFNKKLFSRKRIIKDISSHFMVGYIKKNFPQVSIVALIRNPFAVIDSQINNNWQYGFVKSNELIEDYFKKQKELIYNVYAKGSEYEKNMLWWCVRNYVLIKETPKKELITFYEEYIFNPEKEIRRLFYYLNIEYKKNVLSVLKKPSQTSSEKNIRKERLLCKWQERIPDEEIKKCKKIISAFNLDKIYGDFKKPSREGLANFLNENK